MMADIEAVPALFGRSILVRAVAAELMSPESVGVILVGEAGIGKTAIARQVSDELRNTVRVIPVRGGAGLRSIPYGALSRYLVGLSLADVDSPAVILRHFMKHLSRELRSQVPPVILIDDAHNLDNESCLLIMQLATARKVKVLATARQAPGPSGEFERAAKDGLLSQHLIEPLALADVHELCERLLGGPVLTGTARLLAAKTRGNPLLLTMLVDQGRAQGYLVEVNGVWRARGPRPAIDAPLADLLMHDLGERSDDELAVLEAMAVSGPVRIASLEADVDWSVLAQLVQEQLIEVDPSSEQVVSLKHPLHGEALRGSIPPARALDLAQRALVPMPESPSTPEELTSFVTAALRASSFVEDAVLRRAARVGNRLHDPAFALKVLDAVREPVPTPSYLLEAAWAQWNDRNFALARVLVDESLQGATDPGVVRDGIVLSLHLHLREGEDAGALHDDVERWADLLIAVGNEDGIDPLVRSAALSEVRLLRVSIEIMRGNLHGTPDLEKMPVGPGLPAEVKLAHLGLLAHALVGTGRPQAASLALEGAHTLLEENLEPLLTYRDSVAGEHLMALVCSGSWDRARDLFHTTYPTDTDSGFLLSGWLDLIEGSMSLRAGSYLDARRRLVLAVEAFRDIDGSHIIEWLSGLAAYACARAGDTPGARALIEAHTTQRGQSDAVAHLMGDAYVAAALGHLQEQDAVSRLRWIALRAEKSHSLLVAATALDHAVVLGDRTALEPLAAVTRSFDGEEGTSLHRFAAAAAGGDRQALIVESEAARRSGYLPLAIRCLEEATLIGPPSGAASRSMDRQLSALRAELRMAPGAGAVPLAHGARLTQGEQVIMKLVAAGHSNREIAEIRAISPRTVEGHLYRIFAKLGITRREVLQQPPATP